MDGTNGLAILEVEASDLFALDKRSLGRALDFGLVDERNDNSSSLFQVVLPGCWAQFPFRGNAGLNKTTTPLAIIAQLTADPRLVSPRCKRRDKLEKCFADLHHRA